MARGCSGSGPRREVKVSRAGVVREVEDARADGRGRAEVPQNSRVTLPEVGSGVEARLKKSSTPSKWTCPPLNVAPPLTVQFAVP